MRSETRRSWELTGQYVSYNSIKVSFGFSGGAWLKAVKRKAIENDTNHLVVASAYASPSAHTCTLTHKHVWEEINDRKKEGRKEKNHQGMDVDDFFEG